jgi:hypothetical protein
MSDQIEIRFICVIVLALFLATKTIKMSVYQYWKEKPEKNVNVVLGDN